MRRTENMGIKVAKFGGSSVADGIQLTKTKNIINAENRLVGFFAN